MISTDEVSSIDSKDEIKTDNEGDSNISIKFRTENMINQEDTSGIVENEKDSMISTETYFKLLLIKPQCLVLRWIMLRIYI